MSPLGFGSRVETFNDVEFGGAKYSIKDDQVYLFVNGKRYPIVDEQLSREVLDYVKKQKGASK